ncbi:MULTISPECIES: sigma-54-dependent transcriptional regulator [unclassified Sphingomonas]|uniref:sigma-54-dependent transcriptional regulator n=1 Tax=unclassified Sphingomonas TaxID=196159 RepID=UPI001F34047B|nr:MULTISPECIES: response regulator [unclassified Sphingomonas]
MGRSIRLSIAAPGMGVVYAGCSVIMKTDVSVHGLKSQVAMNERISSMPRTDDLSSLNTMPAGGHPDRESSPRAILLIEDDPVVSRTTEILFRLAGHVLEIAADPATAYSMLARRRYDAILLDMNFTAGRADGKEGLACLARIVADDPHACVVVITAHSGIRIAVTAMQAGARDFIMKPWRKDDLLGKVDAAIRRSVGGGSAHRPAAIGPSGGSALIGTSTAIERVRALVRRVGPTIASVCVTGASGTGRSLVAEALHAASADAGTKPRRIDVTDSDQLSALDDATGTIVLCHADRLDPQAQVRLLQRLMPRLRCITIVDAVAPLSPALRRRLCTIEIPVPPLAERRDDAVLLARHFASVAGETYGYPAPRLTPAAEAFVAIADWPDEVRGLALAIERAVLLSDDGLIDVAAIRPTTLVANAGGKTAPAFGMQDAEKLMIEAALKEHRHNVSRAAAALGLSRGTLYRRMAQHGL